MLSSSVVGGGCGRVRGYGCCGLGGVGGGGLEDPLPSRPGFCVSMRWPCQSMINPVE
jgi:hypothetical protein